MTSQDSTMSHSTAELDEARAILASVHPAGADLFKDRSHMSIGVALGAVAKALRVKSARLEHLERALREITTEYRTYGAAAIDVMFDIANSALNQGTSK